MKQENYELAVELRHRLHAHPELSNEEKWTKATLMEFLRSHTKLEVVDKGSWFYAAYRAGGTAPPGPRTEPLWIFSPARLMIKAGLIRPRRLL